VLAEVGLAHCMQDVLNIHDGSHGAQKAISKEATGKPLHPCTVKPEPPQFTMTDMALGSRISNSLAIQLVCYRARHLIAIYDNILSYYTRRSYGDQTLILVNASVFTISNQNNCANGK
jgi:hypothetical protein